MKCLMKKRLKRTPKIIRRKLGRERAYGQYFEESQTIELDSRLEKKVALDTLIHEALHHIVPRMTEKQVLTTATQLATILWDQNYRRVEQ